MVKPMSVFIMGSGRMGEILAKSLNWNHKVSLYDIDEQKGEAVALRVGCRFCQPKDGLPSSDVLILALPPDATAQAVASISNLLNPEVVLINIATTVLKDAIRPVMGEAEHLVSAKVVGHYREMQERPVIIIDADSEKGKQVAGLMLINLGNVQLGDERMVEIVNSISTAEAFRAAVFIEEKLREAGAGPELISSALRACVPGSIKSYARGDIGPFGQKLLQEIRSDTRKE